MKYFLIRMIKSRYILAKKLITSQQNQWHSYHYLYKNQFSGRKVMALLDGVGKTVADLALIKIAAINVYVDATSG